MQLTRLLFLCCFLFTVTTISSQTTAVQKVRDYINQNKTGIISEFVHFLSIPNVAKDTTLLHDNANLVMEMMNRRGIKNVKLLDAETKDVPPAVYGEAMVPGAKRTLIFYAHYDGQPVNAAQWANGLDPFQPMLFNAAIDHKGVNIPFPTESSAFNPEWRIYSRGSSDDKAGVMAILNAYDAIVKSGVDLSSNIKFFFEGEEEAGSPHLHEILEKHKSLLQSDTWIMCDGPVHQSGKKQIVFGVRGDTHLDLTIYAAKRPLHSGHYGNWAPNPAMMMARLLASMKDENGRVKVKGFYDDVKPLTASEKKALAEVPSVDDQMKNELGISGTDMTGITLKDALNLPSLNINGMQSGNVGKLASNQIPVFATAVIDLRLVLGNNWKKQQQKVMEHIRTQGYLVIDHEPTDEERSKHAKIIKVIPGNDGYNAQRTSMDLPIIKKIITAVQSTTSEKVVLQPTMGGSLPLFLFEKHLNAKTITIPIANHDNNQHAENENIRLKNFWEGIESMAALMIMD